MSLGFMIFLIACFVPIGTWTAPVTRFQARMAALEPQIEKLKSTEDIEALALMDNPTVGMVIQEKLVNYLKEGQDALYARFLAMEDPSDDEIRDGLIDWLVLVHGAHRHLAPELEQLSPSTQEGIRAIFARKEVEGKHMEYELEFHEPVECDPNDV